MDALKLNIGCGEFPMPGYVNIDIRDLDGVDMVCDIEAGLPYPDSSVDEIVAAHVLEHFRDVACALQEFNRVLKPNTSAFIRVPLQQVWQPDHLQCFFEEWFDRNLGSEWSIIEKSTRVTKNARQELYEELAVTLRKV